MSKPRLYLAFLLFAVSAEITQADVMPGSIAGTTVLGSNHRGDVVGTYPVEGCTERPGPLCGYYGFELDNDGTYTSLAYPLLTTTVPSAITVATAINDQRQVVGYWESIRAVEPAWWGFSYEDGLFTQLPRLSVRRYLDCDIMNLFPDTIDNAGRISGTLLFGASTPSNCPSPPVIGRFVLIDGIYYSNDFPGLFASIPEPQTFCLLAGGLLFVFVIRQRETNYSRVGRKGGSARNSVLQHSICLRWPS